MFILMPGLTDIVILLMLVVRMGMFHFSSCIIFFQFVRFQTETEIECIFKINWVVSLIFRFFFLFHWNNIFIICTRRGKRLWTELVKNQYIRRILNNLGKKLVWKIFWWILCFDTVSFVPCFSSESGTLQGNQRVLVLKRSVWIVRICEQR